MATFGGAVDPSLGQGASTTRPPGRGLIVGRRDVALACAESSERELACCVSVHEVPRSINRLNETTTPPRDRRLTSIDPDNDLGAQQRGLASLNAIRPTRGYGEDSSAAAPSCA